MIIKQHQALLEWYNKKGRHDLLWRNTQELYHIYLSEIMLQQTQVKRVEEEYYPQFLEKFPTLKDLAKADLDAVLSAWSGLGYYRRAKNLHATAQLCPDGLPNTQEELLKLPGIGRYTASALCSFGLSQDIPVVDTNIARVLKRFFALLEVSDTQVWKYAEIFLNHELPRSHNLALMDLGSLVCTPKNPLCDQCPLKGWCQGRDTPELYTQVKKKASIAMDLFFGVYIKNNKIALEVSQENMYKDMLVLPSVEPIEEHFLGSYKHAYTKYRLRVHLYRVEQMQRDNLIWVDLECCDTLPISSLTKKAWKFFYA
jgi:A/G-specific adenine glycosylase